MGGARGTSGPCGGRKEGPQRRKGSVTLRERRTINSPLEEDISEEEVEICKEMDMRL